ncbi:hypothetical protein [uncultured Winogradskyella sp.]|uniref:TolB family protein n=1 Tax=uncultured Winogradskyella sp. TaxID=395353 RepID=UPI00260C16B4|nr:hypothetical protein [uncultured Winogradskyella sp.]
MKSTIQLLLTVVLVGVYLPFSTIDGTAKTKKIATYNNSGYLFDVNVTKINSEYSEIPAAVFRDKLVIVSSKKIGAIGNGTDETTGLPYTNLFCSDIVKSNSDFSTPILFSRILNTRGSEGQVSFTPDEHTIFYTRSKRKNAANYQLYSAQLEKDSYGNWKDHTPAIFNSEAHSIENPHVSTDGKFLFFSSNMEGGLGGFDLYKAPLSKNGTLGTPINLGPTINTELDEKYPHTSKDGGELFFSSKGHSSQGGFDIFITNIYGELDYSEPRNLGIKINSIRDEVAFTLLDNDKGVFSSNEGNDGMRFNMYKFNARAIYQDLEGIIFDKEDNTLPNITVVLYDNKGNEIERQTTGKDATYRFKIRPFEQYKIKTIKNGYEDAVVSFKSTDTKLNLAYKEDLKLSTNGTLTKK